MGLLRLIFWIDRTHRAHHFTLQKFSKKVQRKNQNQCKSKMQGWSCTFPDFIISYLDRKERLRRRWILFVWLQETSGLVWEVCLLIPPRKRVHIVMISGSTSSTVRLYPIKNQNHFRGCNFLLYFPSNLGYGKHKTSMNPTLATAFAVLGVSGVGAVLTCNSNLTR